MTPTHSPRSSERKAGSSVSPDTWEKIEFELANLQRLVDTHKSLVVKAAQTEPDDIELSALAAYLHSFYTGVENLLKQITIDIDAVRPTAERWHTDLLRMMASTTDNRPPLITEELLQKLIGYMGFRHVFRHAYPFQLKWSRMKTLVLDSESVLAEIRNACSSLRSYLN